MNYGMWIGYTFSPEGPFYKRFLVFCRTLRNPQSCPQRFGSLNGSETFEAGMPFKTFPAKKDIDQRASAIWGNDAGSLAALLKSFFFYPFDQFIQGGVAQNAVELGTIVVHDADVFNHDVENLPIGIHRMKLVSH